MQFRHQLWLKPPKNIFLFFFFLSSVCEVLYTTLTLSQASVWWNSSLFQKPKVEAVLLTQAHLECSLLMLYRMKIPSTVTQTRSWNCPDPLASSIACKEACAFLVWAAEKTLPLFQGNIIRPVLPCPPYWVTSWLFRCPPHWWESLKELK